MRTVDGTESRNVTRPWLSNTCHRRRGAGYSGRNGRLWKISNMLVLAVLASSSVLNFSARAFDEPAPFGLSWGPADKVPTPSLQTRHANIALFIYKGDRLPSGGLRDTEEIVLQVCKKEGLQQVIWISKLLSAAEEQDRLGSILAEGTRRYGPFEITEQGMIRWNGGQTTVAAGSSDQGHRIFMASNGPGIESCSNEHGHQISDHWMQFLSNPDTK
jgi:hypothetical protein